jgi:hypothetical protein
MIAYDPGRYLCYDEMTSFLQACAAEYPALCQLDEIGRSAEGRAVWAVTLTNTATGAAETKPGYLVDGNTHAGEVTGGAAALYTIWWLLTNYGADPVATEILDTRAFYAVPRIAVDGVELYLTTPYLLRSSPRRYPEPLDLPGFYAEDINGDGEILLMRIPHPDGDWKADTVDPRALARRRPEDREGVFYKLLPEGVQKDWTGPGPAPERSHRRMDFNRNYPAFWNPEARQPGAGPYPLSEPETRALAQFLVGHPNIGAYVTFHTTGGILLRPPSYGPDDEMNPADLEVFQRIGDLCTRVTGCPCKSTYQALTSPARRRWSRAPTTGPTSTTACRPIRSSSGTPTCGPAGRAMPRWACAGCVSAPTMKRWRRSASCWPGTTGSWAARASSRGRPSTTPSWGGSKSAAGS